MLELALHHGEGPVMMQSIADNQGVSRKYLDTIFSSLKNAGLIHSRRGIGGGHVLGRPPADIRVGDILRAIEGPLTLVRNRAARPGRRRNPRRGALPRRVARGEGLTAWASTLTRSWEW